MKIAVLNSGSSSLKCKIFEYPSKALLFSKTIERIGESDTDIASHAEALDALNIDFETLDAIGHRVVHGGEKLQKSVIIDESVVDIIRELIVLAPLHNPANLIGIEISLKKAPHILQVAVFDTAFHASMQKEAYLYALPYELYAKEGIRRYGFHGTSHAYLAKEAAKELKKESSEINIITLHLGNGASACAIKNGVSIDTSMGFTPLEGLVMGTRCGDIDAEIVLYLQRSLGKTSKEIEHILNKESGLLGICGENDLREILLREDEKAKLAINIMVRRIQKYIGAYMVLLENVDAIVFSGGIGENSQEIRDAVMDNTLLKNIKMLVIQTDEELEIANECYRLIKKKEI
ncbi:MULTISPECIES: acetate kinase [Sulfurimonas]|uniref:acetate/propionate family kinase n=1 Tax=Sulfurimonas TaxID=202746 RepID=UPI001264F9E5|nr:acetate kinase [Sulfurimonas indica]